MKNNIMVLLFTLVTMVSFGQTSNFVTKELEDGLDNKNKVTFKVYSPKQFDSLWGKKSNLIIDKILWLTNIELMYRMKNKESYKPIVTPKNSIMYMNFENETNVVVTIIVESKNGYGNPITKEYKCYVTGNFMADNLYDNLKVDISSY